MSGRENDHKQYTSKMPEAPRRPGPSAVALRAGAFVTGVRGAAAAMQKPRAQMVASAATIDARYADLQRALLRMHERALDYDLRKLAKRGADARGRPELKARLRAHSAASVRSLVDEALVSMLPLGKTPDEPMDPPDVLADVHFSALERARQKADYLNTYLKTKPGKERDALTGRLRQNPAPQMPKPPLVPRMDSRVMTPPGLTSSGTSNNSRVTSVTAAASRRSANDSSMRVIVPPQPTHGTINALNLAHRGAPARNPPMSRQSSESGVWPSRAVARALAPWHETQHASTVNRRSGQGQGHMQSRPTPLHVISAAATPRNATSGTTNHGPLSRASSFASAGLEASPYENSANNTFELDPNPFVLDINTLLNLVNGPSTLQPDQLKKLYERLRADPNIIEQSFPPPHKRTREQRFGFLLLKRAIAAGNKGPKQD
jgi:hypothetical protein